MNNANTTERRHYARHAKSTFAIHDKARAWVPHGRFVIPGAPGAQLCDLSFAVKDIYDVAGHRTGFGNPRWLETHAPATLTSPVVQALLDAGATLCGKVITDELAFSLNGDNVHYGTPFNTHAPGCVPGGSSSGSAAAVAAEPVDFALGSDTGGSVRVPASYCGVWGIRSTHGAIPLQGVRPLQPSFDTVGWFAHQPEVFERVGEILLPTTRHQFSRVLHFAEPWQLADPAIQPLLEAVEACVAELPGIKLKTVKPLTQDQHLEDWRMAYHIASAFESWQTHGDWIEQARPDFGEPIAKRFKFASALTPGQAKAAQNEVNRIRQTVRDILQEDSVMVLPSSASTAPRIDANPDEIDQIRMRTMRVTCIAGIAGLPQISIPFRTKSGNPTGVSLLGPAGSDLALLRTALRVFEELAHTDLNT